MRAVILALTLTTAVFAYDVSFSQRYRTRSLESSHDGNLFSVSHSRDGRYVYAMSLDRGAVTGVIESWDTKTGLRAAGVPIPETYWPVGTFSEYFIIANAKGSALMDAAGKIVIGGIDPLTHSSSDQWSAAISPSSKYFALLHARESELERTVTVYELGTGKILSSRLALRQTAVRFSPDEKHLLTAGKSILVHDLATGNLIKEIGKEIVWVEPVEQDATIRSLAVSPDGKLVAAAGIDRFVRVWNFDTGQLLFEKEDRDITPNPYLLSGEVQFSPFGNYLLWIGGFRLKRLAISDFDLNEPIVFGPLLPYYLEIIGNGSSHFSFSPSGESMGFITPHDRDDLHKQAIQLVQAVKEWRPSPDSLAAELQDFEMEQVMENLKGEGQELDRAKQILVAQDQHFIKYCRGIFEHMKKVGAVEISRMLDSLDGPYGAPLIAASAALRDLGAGVHIPEVQSELLTPKRGFLVRHILHGIIVREKERALSGWENEMLQTVHILATIAQRNEGNRRDAAAALDVLTQCRISKVVIDRAKLTIHLLEQNLFIPHSDRGMLLEAILPKAEEAPRP